MEEANFKFCLLGVTSLHLTADRYRFRSNFRSKKNEFKVKKIIISAVIETYFNDLFLDKKVCGALFWFLNFYQFDDGLLLQPTNEMVCRGNGTNLDPHTNLLFPLNIGGRN